MGYRRQRGTTTDNAGRQLDASKCAFAIEEIWFPGYWLGLDRETEIEPENTAAIQQHKTLSGLRSFLGFANSYRDFVLFYFATPMTPKDTPFACTQACAKAFQELQAAFSF